MVQITKIALREILGRALISFEELQTILAKIEAIINSCPLTYVNNGPNEPFPLTPSNFLTGRRVTALPNRSGKRNIELFKGEEKVPRPLWRFGKIIGIHTRDETVKIVEFSKVVRNNLTGRKIIHGGPHAAPGLRVGHHWVRGFLHQN
ncbi:DUF5641 domain-containing protein [Trichonephila clavipes]|nr:DUF5641 domain-containing protein [Trichonephila clavipes]